MGGGASKTKTKATNKMASQVKAPATLGQTQNNPPSDPQEVEVSDPQEGEVKSMAPKSSDKQHFEQLKKSRSFHDTSPNTQRRTSTGVEPAIIPPTSFEPPPADQIQVTLPRGGVFVRAHGCNIQFGAPPETLKDSRRLELEVPENFVIPLRPFNIKLGLNFAEVEFPTYFNFFIMKRQTNLICSHDMWTRLVSMFKETLACPKDIEEDFYFSYPEELRSDLIKECDGLTTVTRPEMVLTIDKVIRHTLLDENSPADLGDGVMIEMEVEQHAYVITKNGEFVTAVPFDVHLQPRQGALLEWVFKEHITTDEISSIARDSACMSIHELVAEASVELPRQFEPPLFGITTLGSSTGFDASGVTSGCVIWVNRRGIMVDPPPDSSSLLAINGVSPSLIDEIILTHGHADHDAGTLQKILTEKKVTVITTPTIMGAFLRKYSGVSGIGEDFWSQLFDFQPCQIGKPMNIHNGHISFFYALHVVPCISFEVHFGGKSMVYTGDHCNDPVMINRLYEASCITEARRDFLLNFQWEKYDLIYHEAGPPPIHTPIPYLAQLPEHIKKKLYVYHVADMSITPDTGLKKAKVGVQNTIIVDVQPKINSEAIQLLDLLNSVDLLELPFRSASDLLMMANEEFFEKGHMIIKAGTMGDKFYVMASGVARIEVIGPRVPNTESQTTSQTPTKAKLNRNNRNSSAGSFLRSQPVLVKYFTTGDFFGENSLFTSEPRGANVIAVNNVTCITVEKYDFLRLIAGTPLEKSLKGLKDVYSTDGWQVLSANSSFGGLSAAQKTELMARMKEVRLKSQTVVWRQGDEPEQQLHGVVFIISGEVSLQHNFQKCTKSSRRIHKSKTKEENVLMLPAGNLPEDPLTRGAYIGDVSALRQQAQSRVKFKCLQDTSAFVIQSEVFLDFLGHNPGLLLALFDVCWNV